jgi:outer membrane receptor for ferrienterochelin and colicins
VLFSFSYNDHAQNSVYGDLPYLADQRIGFGQLTWDKSAGIHDMLAGVALRYSYYDDNTPATATDLENAPDQVWIPGIFIQDELKFGEKQSLLLGLRYDYDNRHGSILTPRVAWKLKWGNQNLLRLNAGSGFRVVNLFTEEHAALTGAREVIIAETLEPERSWNVNLNFLKKIYASDGWFASLDFSVFYTHFGNQILPDYDTNPNQIIYSNLEGRSVARGVSANLDFVFPGGLKLLAGVTLQDVAQTDAEGVRTRQILTENFSGTWSLSYEFRALHLSLDYTGNIYGPMRLPLLGDLDPRQEYSPIWSIQNIQFTYKGFRGFELYGGIKNLLDWTPNQGNPFLIARANDPFDKDVLFDSGGNPIQTPDNPYALTFDPSYVYGPNQGIRAFAGVRYRLN